MPHIRGSAAGAFCTFHINSRVISPKHKPEHGTALPPDPTTFSRTLRMTFRFPSQALKALPTLDSAYLCSFKSLASSPGTIPFLSHHLCHPTSTVGGCAVTLLDTLCPHLYYSKCTSPCNYLFANLSFQRLPALRTRVNPYSICMCFSFQNG